MPLRTTKDTVSSVIKPCSKRSCHYIKINQQMEKKIKFLTLPIHVMLLIDATLCKALAARQLSIAPHDNCIVFD